VQTQLLYSSPKAADGKVRHPDRMAQDFPDEQKRPSGEWKNCLLTSDQDVDPFNWLFYDRGDEKKTFQQQKLNLYIAVVYT
jgi:hypothetical protein